MAHLNCKTGECESSALISSGRVSPTPPIATPGSLSRQNTLADAQRVVVDALRLVSRLQLHNKQLLRRLRRLTGLAPDAQLESRLGEVKRMHLELKHLERRRLDAESQLSLARASAQEAERCAATAHAAAYGPSVSVVQATSHVTYASWRAPPAQLIHGYFAIKPPTGGATFRSTSASQGQRGQALFIGTVDVAGSYHHKGHRMYMVKGSTTLRLMDGFSNYDRLARSVARLAYLIYHDEAKQQWRRRSEGEADAEMADSLADYLKPMGYHGVFWGDRILHDGTAARGRTQRATGGFANFHDETILFDNAPIAIVSCAGMAQ